jgi:hypothetical protein
LLADGGGFGGGGGEEGGLGLKFDRVYNRLDKGHENEVVQKEDLVKAYK